MAKKIIIYNCTYYAGGTIVMSALCKTLRELGYDARVMFTHHYQIDAYDKEGCREYVWKKLIKTWLAHCLEKFLPGLDFVKKNALPINPLTTMSGIKIQYCPFFRKKDSIIIYPETLYGNPLCGKNVVRWLLYHHRFTDVPEAFGSNDLFVCYREVFNDYQLNPQLHTLRLRYFDANLYRQYNYNERKGNCYIIRKGKNRSDLPQHFDGPVFDNNMSEEDLVKMFNEHEYCYSYDTQTFYSSIASICGCKSVVVMEPGKTERDYRKSDDTPHYGVAYGDSPDQLKYAEDTRPLLLQSLDYTERNKQSVSSFVTLLTKHFGELKKIDYDKIYVSTTCI